MKLRIRSAEWFVIVALFFAAGVSAHSQTLLAAATELTDECKKAAEKTKQLSDAVDRANPQAAGRAKEDLDRMAAAGLRMQSIIKGGIPQEPEKQAQYVRDLQNARGEMNMLTRSVERDYQRAPNLADNVLTNKFGEQRVKEMFSGFDQASKSTSSAKFDGAKAELPVNEHIRLALEYTPGMELMQSSQPAVKANYRLAPPEERQKIEQTSNGHIPGGVVLESTGKGVGTIKKITFDARTDAFIVNDNAVYFVRAPRSIVAVIVRALAKDDRIGVSLSTPPEIYGALPKDSSATWNLMLADNFLGTIAFAEQNSWLTGYTFANHYQPKEYRGDEDSHVAAFFRFTGIQFQLKDQIYRVVDETLETRSIPLQKNVDANGGLLSSSSGTVPHEWQENLRHIADNVTWYRREKLIDQVFAYAELAAFLRAAKSQAIDLNSLASQVEAETAIWEALH